MQKLVKFFEKHNANSDDENDESNNKLTIMTYIFNISSFISI